MATYWAQLLGARILKDSDRSAAGDIDTDVVDWVKTNKFILACAIGYNSKDTAAAFYKVYWRNVTDEGTFAEITSSGEIKTTATSAVLVDNNTLTSGERMAGDYSADMTWQDGYEDVGDNRCPDSPSTLNLAEDCWSELQFVFDCSDAHDGDEYEFQLYNGTLGSSAGTLLCTLTMVSTGGVKTYNIDVLLATRTVKTYDIDTRLAVRNTKTYDIDMVLNNPPPESRQVIMGGYYDDFSTSATEYNVLQGGSTWQATESYVTVPWPTSGKFQNLYVECDSRLTGGSYTVSLRKNGASTLSVTLSSGTLSDVDTGQVAVAAGDLICLQVSPTSPTGTPYAFWGVTFIPDTVGETVMTGVIDRAASAATVYAPFMCGAPYNFDTADNFAYASLVPTPGTLKKLHARTTSSTTGSNYLSFAAYRYPDVSSDLIAVCSDDNYPDTTDTIDVNEWNALQMRVVQTGTVADGYCRWAAVFVPDTSGEFVFAAQSTDSPAASGTEYNGLNGQFYSSVWDSTEYRYTMKASEAFTAKKISVTCVSAPGGGKYRAFTLRRYNTADTSLVVTLETDSVLSYATDVEISAGWNLNIKHVPTNTPTVSAGRWAILGYIAPTGGGATEKTYDIDMRLAARTDKTYDVDALLAARKTTTYDIDARLATRVDKTYDADVRVAARTDKTYDIDATVAEKKTEAYDIDTTLATRTGQTYDIDALIALRYAVAYDIDVLVRARLTAAYDIDARLAARTEQTYDIDALLRLRFEPAYDIDALLAARLEEAYDIDMRLAARLTEVYDIDATLAARLEKTYDIDTRLASRYTEAYDIDARVAERKTSAYDIDVILQEIGVPTKSYDIDMLLAARLTKAYDLDTLLALRLTQTYDIDVYIRARYEAAYDIDARLAERKEASYDADALVALRTEQAYDIDTRLASRNTTAYDVDTFLRERKLANYDIDARVALRLTAAYAIDMILAVAGAGVIAAIDGIPWANVAKVCGIPKAQIAKVNGWSTS